LRQKRIMEGLCRGLGLVECGHGIGRCAQDIRERTTAARREGTGCSRGGHLSEATLGCGCCGTAGDTPLCSTNNHLRGSANRARHLSESARRQPEHENILKESVSTEGFWIYLIGNGAPSQRRAPSSCPSA
jgi:hypothetical protein